MLTAKCQVPSADQLSRERAAEKQNWGGFVFPSPKMFATENGFLLLLLVEFDTISHVNVLLGKHDHTGGSRGRYADDD